MTEQAKRTVELADRCTIMLFEKMEFIGLPKAICNWFRTNSYGAKCTQQGIKACRTGGLSQRTGKNLQKSHRDYPLKKTIQLERNHFYRHIASNKNILCGVA